jgi:hypothetical protein
MNYLTPPEIAFIESMRILNKPLKEVDVAPAHPLSRTDLNKPRPELREDFPGAHSEETAVWSAGREQCFHYLDFAGSSAKYLNLMQNSLAVVSGSG